MDIKAEFIKAKLKNEQKIIDEQIDLENRIKRVGEYAANEMNTKDTYVKSSKTFHIKLDENHKIIKDKEINAMANKFKEWSADIEKHEDVNGYITQIWVRIN